MVNKQAGDRLRFKGLTPSRLGEGGKRLPHAAGGMRDGAALGTTLRQLLRETARCSRTAWQLLSPAVTRAGRTHAHAKLCVCV